MKQIVRSAANYSVFLLVALILSGLQSSLWLQLFGWFPAPQLWLTILVFWVLYRELHESVIMMYLLASLSSAFTAQPFPQLLAINLLICLSLYFAKRRVYWSGSTFFMLASAGAVIGLFVYSWLIALRYDRNPISEISLFAWLTTLLLTMLASLPLHRLYNLIDRLMDKEHPAEAGTGVL